MQKQVNIISGGLMALTPFFIVFIFGVLIYSELPNVLGILIDVVLLTLAVYLSRLIFKTVQSRGVVDFASTVYASPDLDNLEPLEGIGTFKRTPEELAKMVSEKEHLLKGGSLRIFGDWFGEAYQNPREIMDMKYDSKANEMTIHFSEQTKLVLSDPDHILESATVLKILSAKAVRLEFVERSKAGGGKHYFKEYLVEGNSLKTATNIENIEMDAAIGQDALTIFN